MKSKEGVYEDILNTSMESKYSSEDYLPRKYLEYRAGTGITHHISCSYLDSILLRPRAMSGVDSVDTSCSLLQKELLSFPMLVAPIAFNCLWNPKGEIETATRAAEFGMGYCYNACYASRSFKSLKEEASNGFKILHLYPWKERDLVEELLRRGEESGLFSGVVVTADHPHDRVRDFIGNELGNHAHEYGHLSEDGSTLPNLRTPEGKYKEGNVDPSLTLEDALGWLRDETKLPIIIKGILCPEDALLAVEYGAEGIVVSNHGGRQIDGAIPSIMALPEVVKAVNGKVSILMDSGIRNSTDIIKALCLGADAVMMGRPVMRALAEGNLQNFLRDLRFQFECDMKSLGCREISDLGPHLLHAIRNSSIQTSSTSCQAGNGIKA